MKKPLLIAIYSLLLLHLHGQDGAHYVSYGVTSGLARADVSSIFLDSRGVLWVGTNGAGFYQFGPGRFSQHAASPEVTGHLIRDIAEDKNGYLYLWSELGILRYDGTEVVSVVAHEEITAFVISESALWWSIDTILYQQTLAGHKQQHVVDADILVPLLGRGHELLASISGTLSLIDSTGHIKAISRQGDIRYDWVSYTIGADSTAWLISRDGHLLHFDKGIYDLRSTGFSDVRDIAAGALGSLWIADAQGISIYQPQDSTSVPLQVRPDINCLYFDGLNRLWIGSSTQGLIRYFGEQNRTWSHPQNAEVQMIYAGATPNDTYLYTENKELVLLGDISKNIRVPETDGDVRQVYRDALSRLWCFTMTRLWMHHDSAWVTMDSSEMSRQGRIFGSDKLGNIWIAHGRELLRYGIKPVTFPTGIKFVSTKIRGNIPEDRTIAILTNKKGRAYRIGEKSVGHLENDTYEQTHFTGFRTWSADIDSSDMLWLGSVAAGIYRMVPERGHLPKPLVTTYPLRSMDILFLEHSSRSLIVGTERNILRFHTDTSGLRVKDIDDLNAEAGIPNVQLDAQDFAVTKDGHVLVSTGQEVIQFSLTSNDAFDDIPSVFFNRILVNGEDLRNTKYKELIGAFYRQWNISAFSASENSIAFHFEGSTVDDENLVYQWRLLGRNDAWSEFSVADEIQFTRLPPGQYVFEVKVCDPAGNCGLLDQPWRFTIRRALWHYNWFWIAFAGVVLLLVLLIYQSRMRRVNQEADREKRRLEAELNALTLEQKSLQLQMNPHFIFNALQAIRSHIHEDKLEDARNNLTRFAKLMRNTLESSRVDKVVLEDELEFLRTYVDVERMSRSLPLVFSLNVNEQVDPGEIEIPPMLIQPVLENAFKYGGDGNEIKVDMDVTLLGAVLYVTIEDNGKGFGASISAHKSTSLDILRTRLAHLGRVGGVEVGRANEKTRVILKIPVSLG